MPRFQMEYDIFTEHRMKTTVFAQDEQEAHDKLELLIQNLERPPGMELERRIEHYEVIEAIELPDKKPAAPQP